jgi:hypothetical protein
MYLGYNAHILLYKNRDEHKGDAFMTLPHPLKGFCTIPIQNMDKLGNRYA